MEPIQKVVDFNITQHITQTIHVVPERFLPIGENQLILFIDRIRKLGRKEKRSTEELVKELFDNSDNTMTVE